MRFSILRIDHVQVAAPAGKEAAAREFYAGILGMLEIEKPEPLKGRGGVWFQFGEQQLFAAFIEGQAVVGRTRAAVVPGVFVTGGGALVVKPRPPG